MWWIPLQFGCQLWEVDCVWNVMAHTQKPAFVFQRNGQVPWNRQGHQFSWLLGAEMCASVVVMMDTPSSEVVWSVLATQSICQFPLHFPSHVPLCAITFQLDCTLNDHEANQEIREPLNVCASNNIVVYGRCNWTQRLLVVNDTLTLRLVFEYIPTGRRSVGQPKSTWEDQCSWRWSKPEIGLYRVAADDEWMVTLSRNERTGIGSQKDEGWNTYHSESSDESDISANLDALKSKRQWRICLPGGLSM